MSLLWARLLNGPVFGIGSDISIRKLFVAFRQSSNFLDNPMKHKPICSGMLWKEGDRVFLSSYILT